MDGVKNIVKKPPKKPQKLISLSCFQPSVVALGRIRSVSYKPVC